MAEEKKITLKPIDSLFSNPQDTGESVQNIRIDILHDFPAHPFKVNIDEDLQAMADDIKDNGVRQPIIVRPRDDGGYEIVSGHRRRKACELAGITEIPAIVKNLTDDEAIIIMCSTNFHQRKTLLPSEKAFAYKMQLEAMKRRAGRPSENYVQSEHNLMGTTSRQELSNQASESEANIQRYIRLTYLIPPLLSLVDERKINFIPAVYLSYLDPVMEQPLVLEQIELGNIPTVEQTKELREISDKEGLNEENVDELLNNREERYHEHYTIPVGSVKKYFPPEMKQKEVQTKIVEIVGLWFKHQQEKNKAQEKSDIQDER